jgi:hypothetical protein
MSDQMNTSFTEVKGVLTSRLLTNDATFIYNGKSIELQLPQNVYVTEMIIYDMAGRIIYKYVVSKAEKSSHFIWKCDLINGLRLLTGRYIVQFKTSTGKTFTRSITWNDIR